MRRVLFGFPRNSPESHSLVSNLEKLLKAEQGQWSRRSFPDGETYLRIETPVSGAQVIILANLLNPNGNFLDLCLMADALKDQGAKEVVLISPYLPYMRQDKVFNTGEALSSKSFAKGISAFFDRLITIDPHLHRIHDLNEIYSIPTQVLHATELIAQWISNHVKDPFIIGPDGESSQWARAIAGNHPWICLSKVRHGDHHVTIDWPPLETFADQAHGRTPVFVDDIISSGTTMMRGIEHLNTLRVPLNLAAPIAITIHPIFAGNSFDQIRALGTAQIISTNALPHLSNSIDVAGLIAANF